MENFSIVGFLIIVAIVFLILKWSNSSGAKEGLVKETNTKLMWVAVIACLALLGWFVVGNALFGSN